jgi:hypothetical protein
MPSQTPTSKRKRRVNAPETPETPTKKSKPTASPASEPQQQGERPYAEEERAEADHNAKCDALYWSKWKLNFGMHRYKTLAQVEAEDPDWIYKFAIPKGIASTRPEFKAALEYHLMSLMSPTRREQPRRGWTPPDIHDPAIPDIFVTHDEYLF